MIRRDFCQVAGMATGWFLVGGLPRFSFGAGRNNIYLQIATTRNFEQDLVLQIKGSVKPPAYTTQLNDGQTYFWRQTVLLDDAHTQVYHGRLLDEQLGELLDLYDDKLLPFIDQIVNPPKDEDDQGEDNDDQGMGKTGLEIPERLEMAANYPNPFAARTTIPISLPEAEHVTILVYDTRGKEVAVVFDASLPAGIHRIDWLAANLPSGAYTIVLRVGELTRTRQAVLLR